MATYLSIINKVLIRLREEVAVAPTDTDYTLMVGYLVNDAKRIVEAAWDWTALRDTKTVTTVADTSSYTITGSGSDFKLMDVYNSTQKTRMELISSNEMNNKVALSTAAAGAPSCFSYNGTDGSGDQQILVYPIPDAVYALKFDMVVREAELEAATDVTTLPEQPVVMYAWAMATRERGETGGTAAQELFGLADRSLADAISLDASRYQAELTWSVR